MAAEGTKWSARGSSNSPCGCGREPERTLEALDFSFNTRIIRQQIFDLATGHFLERDENVLIQGPAGVGKSGRLDVLFTSACGMLAHLHGGRGDGTTKIPTEDRTHPSHERP